MIDVCEAAIGAEEDLAWPGRWSRDFGDDATRNAVYQVDVAGAPTRDPYSSVVCGEKAFVGCAVRIGLRDNAVGQGANHGHCIGRYSQRHNVFPGPRKPEAMAVGTLRYCGPRSSVKRWSPRLMVPKTELVKGEITVIVFEDWSPV